MASTMNARPVIFIGVLASMSVLSVPSLAGEPDPEVPPLLKKTKSAPVAAPAAPGPGKARVVAMNALSLALKAEIKKLLAEELRPSKPAVQSNFHLTPGAMVSPNARITGTNLVAARPDAFLFKIFSTWENDGFRESERAVVEMRLANLLVGTSYFVDCTFVFHTSKIDRVAAPPMPTFSVARNDAVVSEAPAGSSLNDAAFHFITGFNALDGENVLRAYVRGTPGGGRAEDGITDWTAEWNGCEVEALR
jgi:hypothetical protein